MKKQTIKTLQVIFISLGVILITMAMTMVTLETLNYEQEYKEVDCFDRSSNKIIGQTCIETNLIPDISNEATILFFSGFLLMIIGFIIMDPYL